MGEVRRAVAVKVRRHRDGAARDPRKRNPCVATAWDASGSGDSTGRADRLREDRVA
jgi:hypothetical protein